MRHDHVGDPGPAARTAKNDPAGPGLPNSTDEQTRRNPMVAASNVAGGDPVEPESAASEVAALLRTYPSVDASRSERVAWYFAKADVLRRIAAEGGPEAEQAAKLARRADAAGFAVAREAVNR